MLCERCNKRPATIHIKKVLNDKKTELHLCEQCAKHTEDMPSLQTPFSINHFLTGLIDSVQDSPLKVDYIQTTKCDRCGMSYGEFRQLGRLGCSACYKAFDEKLNLLIKRVQRSDCHEGKIPKRAGHELRLKTEIRKMKTQLNEAVQKEEFEKAAVLRDKIKELENQFEA